MNNNGELDILQLVSIALGMQNLQENREQSAHNDVQSANDKQAQYLLEEIRRLFAEQNRILAKQNVLLKRILRAINTMKGTNEMSAKDLRERIWRIIAREGIEVTNQNLDWLIERAYKEKANEQSE